MTSTPSTLLRDVLGAKAPPDISLYQWDLLVRQARRANLLARLAIQLCRPGNAERVPAPVLPHLESALTIARRQDIAIRWEVRCIAEALRDTGVPLVLLKGAAYVVADLPAADGRLFSDVDIMVPKEALPTVESALLMHGWHPQRLDDYDQRYYRRWMHEIPPMEHVRRGTVIDVHHSILPETARLHANATAILDAAVPVGSETDVRVLAPTDMILHSATHLFHEGELHNGLRDLFDLDSLIRHFASTPDFWQQLSARAATLGLQRPLFYALRYTRLLLGTPVPKDVPNSRALPSLAVRAAMDFCYRRALSPEHASCSDTWTPLARWLVYVRSHWIKMPLPLLVYHLTRKALKARFRDERREADPTARAQ